jgi:hypothetical protein
MHYNDMILDCETSEMLLSLEIQASLGSGLFSQLSVRVLDSIKGNEIRYDTYISVILYMIMYLYYK